MHSTLQYFMNLFLNCSGALLSIHLWGSVCKSSSKLLTLRVIFFSPHSVQPMTVSRKKIKNVEREVMNKNNQKNILSMMRAAMRHSSLCLSSSCLARTSSARMLMSSRSLSVNELWPATILILRALRLLGVLRPLWYMTDMSSRNLDEFSSSWTVMYVSSSHTTSPFKSNSIFLLLVLGVTLISSSLSFGKQNTFAM